MKKIIAAVTTIIFAATVFIIPGSVVEAESVVWTKTYNQNLYATFGKRYYLTLKRPSVQIKYDFSVRNDLTGELYACGDNVPKNTKLTFDFTPHEYTDVFWFGTGSAFDSPYGSWVRDAKRGTGAMCVEKNYYFTETGRGFVNATKHYANLSVNPPEKRVEGLDDASCVSVDGSSQTCTFDETGQLDVSFGFGETFGKFYHGWTHKIKDRGICKLAPGALVTIDNNTSAKFVHFYGTAAERASLTIPNSGLTGFSKPAGSADPVTDFLVQIPEQIVNCPINIIDPEGDPPTAPVIGVGGVGIGGDRACRTGVVNTYTFTSTDTDTSLEQSSIRYVVDWDNDGTADQMLPATGFVPSRTTLSATKVWRTPGAKTFRAKAQDKQGLSSDWTSYTTDECTGEIINDDLLDRDAYGTYPDGEVSFDLGSGLTNNTCTATWNAEYVSSCSLLRNGVVFREGIDTSGEEKVGPGVYQMKCTQLKDGSVLSTKRSCVQNPNLREV